MPSNNITDIRVLCVISLNCFQSQTFKLLHFAFTANTVFERITCQAHSPNVVIMIFELTPFPVSENILSITGIDELLQCFRAKSFHSCFAVRNIAYNEITFVE